MDTQQPMDPATSAPAEAERRWWLGTLATVKLTADQSGGALTILEVLIPEGYEVPPHVHHREHETFCVLEGELTFTVGDETVAACPADVLFAPMEVPHQFRVDRGPARLMYLLTPGGFEGFVRASGDVADSATLPPAHVVPDFERLPEIAARWGNELLT